MSSFLFFGQNRIHPPPTFGSSSNLEALALQTNKNNIEDGDNAMGVTPNFNRYAS
jgi:hypothetical protein